MNITLSVIMVVNNYDVMIIVLTSCTEKTIPSKIFMFAFSFMITVVVIIIITA